MLRIKDLYNNTSSLINDIVKFQNAEWFNVIKELADDFIQIHYNERFVNDLFVREDNNDTVTFIKKIIELCIKTNEYTFSKLYETTILEYNPLWNVDGTETTERDYTSSNKNNQTINTTDKTTIDSTNTNTFNATNNSDATQSKTTYDSDTLHVTDKNTNVSNGNGTDTNTIKSSDNLTKTGTVADDRNIIDKETITHTRQGNIGLTKSTDLILSQRQVVEFNFIKEVCHRLVNEFTILID